MDLSSKDANNIVYLEEVAVSHTKHFLVTRGHKGKKILCHFDGDCTRTGSSNGKLIWFLFRDLAVKSIYEVYERRDC